MRLTSPPRRATGSTDQSERSIAVTCVASYPFGGWFFARWLSSAAENPLFQFRSKPSADPFVSKTSSSFQRNLQSKMRLLFTLSLICLLAAVISAKKQVEENNAEPETKEHASKKYSKEYQKPHHHGGHKHKKQHHVREEEPLVAEPAVPKQAPVDVPEPEAALQADIGTSKKSLEKQKQREQTEDLHLQDLTYEENLKKDKKKKAHRGTHQAEVTGKKEKKTKEQKLFADQESKNPVEEKVIEDSFEPLTEKRGKEEKNKGKKNKGNNKKAYEKSKDKGNKKSKDSKKSKNGKNKDKKNKSKDNKKW